MRELKNWLQTYFEYTAKYSEAPEHFHWWVGISTIASALRRRVWFHMGDFNWYPNFYVILVAGPGIANKSTAAGIGQRLLERAEIEAVKFAPTSGTWQGIAQKMMRENASSMTILSSELGQLLKTEDNAMLTFFTDLWDGKDSYSHEIRTGDPIVIEEPWINMLGCTTPGWMRDSFKDVNITGGFASRCCFIFGESKSKLIPFPGTYSSERRPMEAALVRDLRQISRLNGEYTMESAAYSHLDRWYRHWHNGKTPRNEDELGFHSRAQGHLFKLAMVIAAAQRDGLRITLDDAKAAEDMLEIATLGQQKIVHDIETEAARPQGRILNFIKKNGKVREATIKATFIRKIPAPQIDLTLKSLERSAVVKLQVEKGRRVVVYMGDSE